MIRWPYKKKLHDLEILVKFFIYLFSEFQVYI